MSMIEIVRQQLRPRQARQGTASSSRLRFGGRGKGVVGNVLGNLVTSSRGMVHTGLVVRQNGLGSINPKIDAQARASHSKVGKVLRSSERSKVCCLLGMVLKRKGRVVKRKGTKECV